jgi:hypothetical protein
MSRDPAPLLTREAVKSVLIQHDLDRFIRRELITSVPNPIQAIGEGIAVILMAVGLLNIIETNLWLTGVQTMLWGVVIGLLSFGIPLLVAFATRSGGFWDRSVHNTMKAYAMHYLHLSNFYNTPKHLDPVVNLLTLVATAPGYIAEAERYAYWQDTLAEARLYLEAEQTLKSLEAKRTAARERLAHLYANTPPAPAPRKWSLLPAPPARQDPLLTRATEHLTGIEARYETVNAYLATLHGRLQTRERHLRYAIAATETYLAEPGEPVLLPVLEPVASLPHAAAVRALLPASPHR